MPAALTLVPAFGVACVSLSIRVFSYVNWKPDAHDHPGHDTNWDLTSKGLVFNWNDKTIDRLMQFYSEAMKSLRKATSALQSRQPHNHDPTDCQTAKLAPHEEHGRSLQRSERVKATATVKLLSVTLMRDGRAVVRMEMTGASCMYEGATQGSKTSGKLGNFVVVDLSGEEGQSRFREKLGLRDTSQSVVTFTSHRYAAGSEGYPGYDSMLEVEMSSTRLVYMRGFMEDLRQYMSEEPLISSIMGMTASAVAESAKKAAGHHRRGQGLMKVRCRLVNPLVVLPVDEGREEALVADLGEILLENRFEGGGDGGRSEHFAVQVKAMNLQEAGGSYLMENVDISFDGRRSLETAVGFAGTALEVDASMSDLVTSVSDRQVALLRMLASVLGSPAASEKASVGGGPRASALSTSPAAVGAVSYRANFQGAVLTLVQDANDAGGAPCALAVCRVSHVEAAYSAARGRTEFAFAVASIGVEDSTVPEGHTGKSLLSSITTEDSTKALARASCVWVSPDEAEHLGYDTGLELDFQGLELSWNDTTIASLVRFYYDIQHAIEAGSDSHVYATRPSGSPALLDVSTTENQDQSPSTLSANADASNETVSTSQVDRRVNINVQASIQSLGATLMRDGRAVVRMEMTGASCMYEGATQGSKTSGKLGNFVVVDLSGEEGQSRFREKLGLRDTSQSVVTFTSHRYAAGSEGYPGYDSMLEVEMSSTRLVYMRGFMEDLRQYMSEEPLISSIMGMTASAVAESAKKAAGHHRRGQGLMKVRCRLVNPLVVLPVDEGREEALVADLGEILLENRFEGGGDGGRSEHFAVQVKAMNLQEAGGSYLMEKVDLSLDGARMLESAGVSKLHAHLDVSDLKFGCSSHQLELVSQIWGQVVTPGRLDAGESHLSPAAIDEEGDGDDFVEASEVEPWLDRREWRLGIACTSFVASLKSSGSTSQSSEIARLHITGVTFGGALMVGRTEASLTIAAAEVFDSASHNAERLLLSSATPFSSSSLESEHPTSHLATIRYTSPSNVLNRCPLR